MTNLVHTIFLEETEYIPFCVRISRGRLDDDRVIIRESSATEDVFAVPFVEATTLLHGHGGKKLERENIEDGGILFFLLPYFIPQIAQDHDARLGSVGGQVLVPLGDHYIHGGKGLRDVFGKATKAIILLEGDFCAVVIFDEPVLLLEVGF